MSLLLFLSILFVVFMLTGAVIMYRAHKYDRAQDYRRAADLAWIACAVFLGAAIVAAVRIAIKVEGIG